jgi:asparagine synthase (glutamine-hydrolysing)
VTFEAAQERTAELLIEAVGSRLTSDDRLAVTLSGGLDSTTLAFIAGEHYSKQLSTFTLGSGPEDQDVKLARATAGLLKSEHHEFFVSFEDYLQAIPRYVRLLERPLLAVETPFLLLCEFMSRTARTCLVGEAADHVFAGGLDYFFDKRIRRRLDEGTARARRLGLRVSADITALVADLCGHGGYDQYVRNLNQRGLTDVCPAGGQFYFACAQEFDLEVRDPYLHIGLVNYLSSLPMSFKVDRARLIDKYLLRYTSLSLFGSKVLEAALCRKRGLAGSFREYGKRFERLCQARLPDGYVAEHPYGRLFPDKHHLVLLDLFQQTMIEQHGHRPKEIELLAFIDERADAAAPASSRRG